MKTTLPIHPIDLEPFRLGRASDRAEVAKQLDRAGRDSGFLLVTGHGVAPELCTAVLDEFGAFFDQPVAEKQRYVVADEAANRGFSGVGKEKLAYSRGEDTPPDLFEAFNVGREDADGPYYDQFRAFYAPNVWPEHPSTLRAVWQEYEDAVRHVADQLLRVAALALDLEERWFVQQLERAIITTRAIDYQRPAGVEATPDQLRMGAHTDYGTLTVLLADDVPGLQVWRNERWHDISVPPGSFVCNIGDMLEHWTNDRWTSTLHRVVPPPASTEGPVRRRAIARFLDCEPDLVVSTIPSCIDRRHPAKYEPVVAGEWLMQKVLGSRALQLPDLDAAAAAGKTGDA